MQIRRGKLNVAGKLCGVFHTFPHLLVQHSGGSEDSCLCPQRGAWFPISAGAEQPSFSQYCVCVCCNMSGGNLRD